MSVIGNPIIDIGVQALVIIIIKILGDAGFSVGQVSKNGPLADFEYFGFEARPEAFGLGTIVAVAAAALRAQGFVVVLALCYLLLLRTVPCIVAAGRHLYQLAEQSQGIMVAWRLDETVVPHWSGVCESLRS